MTNPDWRSRAGGEHLGEESLEDACLPVPVSSEAQQGFHSEEMRQLGKPLCNQDVSPACKAVYFTTDASGVITSVSVPGATYLGYEPESLIGQSIDKRFQGIDQTRFWQAFRVMIQFPDRGINDQFSLLRADGSPITMQVTAQQLQGLGLQTGILLNCEVLEVHPDAAATEESLRQQTEREQLVSAIAQHIRCSLNLKQVLNTTVAEVRQFLQTDRVLIFRFEQNWSGTVLVESVGSGWKSILGKFIADSCFADSYLGRYQRGETRAVADVQAAGLSSCYRKMLNRFEVKAILVVPIIRGEQLWGLLIAHHCHSPRPWHSLEMDLLKQLSGQVSIAIQQSELYQQVQRLNADLERQVQKHAAQLELASEFEATLKRITDRVRDSLDEDQILQTAVQELAIATGVSGCNAALYDLEQRTSTVLYEYTAALAPFQGRVVLMDNFPEGYQQLLQGQFFQFCSLIPNPHRGRVAMLACPIVDDQGVLGDLWLISKDYHAFNDQDIRLVQQVANQCAIALRQARLYQAAQAQVKELEKLNGLKDDFLSTVSHELRTPMSNIKLSTQMLEITLRRLNLLNDSSSPLEKYFQILRDECEREIGLINDLLDLSRLEAGSEPLVLSEVLLQGWIVHLIPPFIERALSHQQQLKTEIPSDFPKILTDLSYLERIVNELLNNACKYTPAGETITLSVSLKAEDSELQRAEDERKELNQWQQAARNEITGCLLPSTSRSPAFFQLQVSNSGVEIAEAELSRVFDKFYRIPNNDPWRHGGTGLGLALVRKLVETLGGTIHVASEAGLTCFTVELPLSPLVAIGGNS